MSCNSTNRASDTATSSTPPLPFLASSLTSSDLSSEQQRSGYHHSDDSSSPHTAFYSLHQHQQSNSNSTNVTTTTGINSSRNHSSAQMETRRRHTPPSTLSQHILHDNEVTGEGGQRNGRPYSTDAAAGVLPTDIMLEIIDLVLAIVLEDEEESSPTQQETPRRTTTRSTVLLHIESGVVSNGNERGIGETPPPRTGSSMRRRPRSTNDSRRTGGRE